MKKLLILLSIIFSFSSCGDDDHNKSVIENPVSRLPPATQNGANTGGCLVNGQLFLPKGNGTTLYCFYDSGLNFSLSIAMNINDSYKQIVVASLNHELVEGQTYQLHEYGPGSQFAEYSINAEAPPSPNYYGTTSSVIGELKITHHDFDHAIISGMFWFDAVNSNNDKVQVREGRFDMEY